MSDNNYTVADLAAEFGITPRAIRLYESKGLITSRRVGRTMIYDHRQRARLKIVLRSKRVGFSLEDTKSYLDLYDADRSNPERLLGLMHQCRTRLQELEAQRRDLDATIAELQNVEQAAGADLSQLDIAPEEAYQQFLQRLPLSDDQAVTDDQPVSDDQPG
ncbi:MerR family transcriptional regulator [Thalassolituus hydrocarboniclasticus]|uniref:MerR family DNA-binding transcriptional regulator n=1 Tax=Thalassolituus hydrocarboniclasticus TaxID=2742796 RepID=A0ABY6AEU2_9GAMM|nr:MerR family DNA-binding transcriptional regulator [Thalassolituus hydrocarboniclasticus]UXD88375.1 MerR family DNA-binding transcriptional regulator [Thalassolituus hydrocarboniclasticus]